MCTGLNSSIFVSIKINELLFNYSSVAFIKVLSKFGKFQFFNFYREHEWFQKDLPAYLFPASNDQDTSLINTSALMEVCEVSICLLMKVVL